MHPYHIATLQPHLLTHPMSSQSARLEITDIHRFRVLDCQYFKVQKEVCNVIHHNLCHQTYTASSCANQDFLSEEI